MSRLKPRNEEFDPRGFGLFGDELQTERSLHPWRQLGRQAMMFQVAVAGNDDTRKLKVGQVTDEIDRKCDQFIEAFVDATDRSAMVAPFDLRGYLTLRVVKACLICKNNEQTGVPPPPFYKENFRKEILELLIDDWYDARYDDLPGWSQPAKQ